MVACLLVGRASSVMGASFSPSSSDSLLSHVEQLLRAFILKISVCDAVLDHNPPGVLTPTPLSWGVSVATWAWSAVSGPYCAVSSHEKALSRKRFFLGVLEPL